MAQSFEKVFSQQCTATQIVHLLKFKPKDKFAETNTDDKPACTLKWKPFDNTVLTTEILSYIFKQLPPILSKQFVAAINHILTIPYPPADVCCKLFFICTSVELKVCHSAYVNQQYTANVRGLL